MKGETIERLPDLFAVHHPAIIVLDAIGKKLGLGGDVLIESGQYKCGDIIAQPLRAYVTDRCSSRCQ